MKPKISLTVEPYEQTPKGRIYLVVKAVNTTEHTPGDRIEQNRLDTLIRAGVTVTVIGAK